MDAKIQKAKDFTLRFIKAKAKPVLYSWYTLKQKDTQNDLIQFCMDLMEMRDVSVFRYKGNFSVNMKQYRKPEMELFRMYFKDGAVAELHIAGGITYNAENYGPNGEFWKPGNKCDFNCDNGLAIFTSKDDGFADVTKLYKKANQIFCVRSIEEWMSKNCGCGDFSDPYCPLKSECCLHKLVHNYLKQK